MTDEQKVNDKNNDSAMHTPKADPETLHKTDPQDNMEGPVSSTLQKTGEAFDTDENQKEADREREKGF